MKKLFVAPALALAVTLASQQTASAWSEFKFGVGVNFGWCGGGNRILWGAYHSAPYACGPDIGPYFPGLAAAYTGIPSYATPPFVAPGGHGLAPLPPLAPGMPHVHIETYGPVTP
jgi:hypothetical protein